MYRQLRMLMCILFLLSFSLTTHVSAQTTSQQINTPTSPSIVGGQDADPGEWPWQAKLSTGCGGVLISTRWVATAAHCLDKITSIQVVLGEHNTAAYDGTEQFFTSSTFLSHPGYKTGINDNDIGLIFLPTPAVTTHAVQPISFEDLTSVETEGTVAWTTGWGTTKEGQSAYPQILREVDVPVITNATCLSAYYFITDNMICAGYAKGGKDSCQGDSGGPLVAQNSEGIWKLVGITSFGRGCARENAYGVYTRMSRYLTWIRDQTSVVPTWKTPLVSYVIGQAAGVSMTLEVSNTAPITLNQTISLTLSNVRVLHSTVFTQTSSGFAWSGPVPPGGFTTELFVAAETVASGSIMVCREFVCQQGIVLPEVRVYLPLAVVQ